MNKKPILIKGGIHIDKRGSLMYNNGIDTIDFDIRRFYLIEPQGLRGWHGHRVEEKLFTAVSGIVKILLVRPDDWSKPSTDLPLEEYVLTANGDTLYIPGGYASAMKCITESGSVLVHSNKSLQESSSDSYKFAVENWYFESYC